jgi:hypothetical protein
MTEFTEDTIDLWLEDFGSFRESFIGYIDKFTYDANCIADIDIDKLELAHTRWVDNCQYCRVYKFPEEAEHLSYAKIFGFLIFALSQCGSYVSEVHFSELSPESPEVQATREDLSGAPEIVLAVDFALDCMDAIEVARTDRSSPFQDRMTPALRHDFIHYVHKEEAHMMGIVMVLQAYYARF